MSGRQRSAGGSPSSPMRALAAENQPVRFQCTFSAISVGFTSAKRDVDSTATRCRFDSAWRDCWSIVCRTNSARANIGWLCLYLETIKLRQRRFLIFVFISQGIFIAALQIVFLSPPTCPSCNAVGMCFSSTAAGLGRAKRYLGQFCARG